MRDTIALCKFCREVSLTSNRRTTNEHFKREKTSKVIEFLIKHFHRIRCDALLAVPIIILEKFW